MVIEAGVTFLQLAEWLHERNASIGYTLVNWNISMAGAVAMGAHRSSIREDSMVAAGVLSVDIINGSGDIVTVERDESSDDWLAASTSLGLLGVIARMKFKIYPDFKVFAKQDTVRNPGYDDTRTPTWSLISNGSTTRMTFSMEISTA